MKQCYICGARATTAEHLPPKVFFPERKDLQVEFDDPPDLRVNLITLPACEAHNHVYSEDDEYMAFAIAAHIGANEFASNQWQTKVARALSRSPKLRAEYGQMVQATGHGSGAGMLQLDLDRLSGVAVRIARGLIARDGMLHASEFRSHFPDLVRADGTPDPDLEQLATLCAPLEDKPWHGSNREVFAYQLYAKLPLIVVRLRFYGAFNVILVSNEVVSMEERNRQIMANTGEEMGTRTASSLVAIYGGMTPESAELIGTGTFVTLGGEIYILTAEHVVGDVFDGERPSRSGDAFAYGAYVGGGPEIEELTPICFIADDCLRHEKRDIALIRVAGLPGGATAVVLNELDAPDECSFVGDFVYLHGFPGDQEEFSTLLGASCFQSFSYCTVARRVDDIIEVEFGVNAQHELEGGKRVRVEAHGLSGSLLWLTGRRGKGDEWSSEDARPIAVAATWDKQSDDLVCVPLAALNDLVTSK